MSERPPGWDRAMNDDYEQRERDRKRALLDPSSSWIERMRQTPDLSRNNVVLEGDLAPPPPPPAAPSEGKGKGKGKGKGGGYDGGFSGGRGGGGGKGRGGGSKGGKMMRDGDWACPNCTNVNFARRDECNRCGQSKPIDLARERSGYGRGGGDKGYGRGGGGGKNYDDRRAPEMRDGDWNCKACGNLNWRKRLSCNKCGISKPDTDGSGSREGRAGGFNERQDDEEVYKKPVVEEDGYDESACRVGAREESRACRSRPRTGSAGSASRRRTGRRARRRRSRASNPGRPPAREVATANYDGPFPRRLNLPLLMSLLVGSRAALAFASLRRGGAPRASLFRRS